VKYLIIFLLLLCLWTFVLWRMRPYIQMARKVLGMVKDVRISGMDSRTGAPSSLRDAKPAEQRLVRCATCNTWVPAGRAVKLGSGSQSFCSHECLERAADPPQRARRSS
jgi:hypothetical protein